MVILFRYRYLAHQILEAGSEVGLRNEHLYFGEDFERYYENMSRFVNICDAFTCLNCSLDIWWGYV